MRGTWFLACAAVLTAGCAAPPATDLDGTMSSGSAGRDPDTPAEPQGFVLRFGDVDAGSMEQTWEGAFAPHEVCNPVGCALGTYTHSYEITQLLPEKVLTRAVAVLDYNNPLGVFLAPMDLFGQWEDVEVYDLEVDTSEPGVLKITSLLYRASGQAFVEVAAYWPSDAAPETAYALSFTSAFDPSFVEPGVPTRVSTGGAPSLNLTALGDGAISLSAYDLDGTFLGRHDGNGALVLPTEGRQDLVLVGGHDSGPFSVVAPQAAGPLEALPLRYELGPTHATTPNQATTWTFEAPQVPLAVGAYGVKTQEWWVQYGETRVSVKGPGGDVLDEGYRCNVCFSSNDLPFVLTSPLGAPGLHAGTYEATVTLPVAAFQEVGEVLVYFGT